MASNPVEKFSQAQLGMLVERIGGEDVVNEILSDGAKVEVKVSFHVVDCDATPPKFRGLNIAVHKKQGIMKVVLAGGNLYVDGKRIGLCSLEEQQNGIMGYKLFIRLVLASSNGVLNANLLDYLIANPSLVPESWKVRDVNFLGTIYEDSNGLQYVRYLCWDGSEFFSECRLLKNPFFERDASAVLLD